MASFPKFLLGDNTDYPDAIFIIHTEFPRFILNLADDEVEWLEEFDKEDEEELAASAEGLIQEATTFYDREISRYE
ncbi:MAG: hypothetical protein D8H93_11170 [Capnocytophaga sp.]|uniref:hypothetical protein n=1 Tax=Capnocytophaga sp. oral taxon 863 TaxID=1227265 RepID=UPI0003966551|nr:hypothetical protein [Capnocytophaga sp. oral taxon 863]ERI64907.1 hypothetical protein HMPREF1551_00101 [Capnocytophaga sp. oral taxon 863 str. F0517]RKW14063.1 MAG: hypothetical protein D8H93_11170 [Capnocytophaga sp.]